MPLLRKSKRIRPLLPKQPDKVKLLRREELGKPLPLNKELRQLDSKLKKDVENKQLLVKEVIVGKKLLVGLALILAVTAIVFAALEIREERKGS